MCDAFDSHSHLDHVLSIGLLADSVMRVRSAAGRGPIRVHALPETLAALRAHIFNGAICCAYATHGLMTVAPPAS